VTFSSTVKNKIVRNLNISITFASGVWRSSQPMQKVLRVTRNDLYAALVDYLQDHRRDGVGTGDDSHERGIFRLPLYYLRNMLHYLRLNWVSNPKVVRRKSQRWSLSIASMVTSNL